MIYLLDETCLFKTEQLSKVCLKRLFCGPIAQFVSLLCMLTLKTVPFLTAGVWELVTLMLAICHLILTAGCLTFTLKAVIHEPRGTVVTTVCTGCQVSRRPAQTARVSRPLNQVLARTETGSATGRTPELKHGLLYNSTYYRNPWVK